MAFYKDDGATLVYIVVLAWNHWEMTAACLHSILQMSYPYYAVILVDNWSTDGTANFVRQSFPEVTVLAQPRNLGFAAGCNVGIRHALAQGAEFVFLLNNDTLVDPNVLDVLVQRAMSLPRAGVLAPRICYMNDPERLWFAGSKLHHLTLEAMNFGPEGPRSSSEGALSSVDYLFGTALLIRRAVLEKTGLFDEAFFMYYEDMDFSLRAREA